MQLKLFFHVISLCDLISENSTKCNAKTSVSTENSYVIVTSSKSTTDRYNIRTQTIGRIHKPYPFKFRKGCLPQILLGPFLNTLSQL